MKLLAAEQRGVNEEKRLLYRRKRRGIDPNYPTPAPPLQGEGTGGVKKLKKNLKLIK